MRTAAFTTLLTICALAVIASPAGAHGLTYGKAKREAQSRADLFANPRSEDRTTVNSLIRQSKHRYFAQAKWTRVDPVGCKGCGYDESTGEFFDTPTTEYCSAELSIRYRSHRSRRPVGRIVSSSCF